MNLTIPSRDVNPYYPPPESEGGWRFLMSNDDVRTLAEMDAHKIEQLFELRSFLFGNYSSSIVIIRHGHLVRECYTFMGLIPSRFDIWSCTMSFAGTAWGLLLDQSIQGLLPEGQNVDLESSAYSFQKVIHYLIHMRKKLLFVIYSDYDIKHIR